MAAIKYFLRLNAITALFLAVGFKHLGEFSWCITKNITAYAMEMAPYWKHQTVRVLSIFKQAATKSSCNILENLNKTFENFKIYELEKEKLKREKNRLLYSGFRKKSNLNYLEAHQHRTHNNTIEIDFSVTKDQAILIW